MSLKGKEDASEFSDCSGRNYSNYSDCIILTLCGILPACSDVHGSICASIYMWQTVRRVPQTAAE